MVNAPVPFTRYFVFASSQRSGIAAFTTTSRISDSMRSWVMPGSCCAATTTVWTRCGTPREYSTVTWLFPSGRSHARRLDFRAAASSFATACASVIGSGISSSVSRTAKPNIIPWSPAPSSCGSVPARASSDSFTP